MKRFKYHNPGMVVFGEGAAAKVAGKELARLGGTRAILVTDEVLSKTEAVKAVIASLGDMLVAEFAGVVPDTGVDIVERALAMAREAGADSVISVGGGSSIDTAKALAATMGSANGDLRELIGFNKLKEPPVPHLVIPTTAGTGSECTSMAVIKDHEKGRKMLMMDPAMVPPLGLLDPVMTVTMPPSVTASTGMDAMTHAAESIMSVNANPFTDALALHAIESITRYLPQARSNGEDLEARGRMLVASAEAGQAFTNAYVGVVHAMAHSLGGLAGVPHGVANGILLWAGMAYNAEAAPERVAMIGAAMGIVQSGDAEADAAQAVLGMQAFADDLGLPSGLEEAGVSRDMLDEVAARSLKDPSMGSNPRRTKDPAEIRAILDKCF